MFFSSLLSLIILSSTVLLQVCQGLTPQNRRYFQNVQYCNTTTDCDAPNSICHIGRCMCSNGYIPYRETPKSRDTCFKEATVIGDFCNKDIQCSAAFGTNSECKYDNPYNLVGRCQCKNNAHFLNGICYKSSYIGQPCEVNDNCVTKSKHTYAFCDHSRCICPPGHHASEDGTDCLISSGIGGTCVSNIGCIVLNSECKNGACSCQKGHTLSNDKKYCLTVAEGLGEPCVETLQCRVQLNQTICNMTSQVCVCEPGTHSKNGACWRSAELLEPCSFDVECQSEFMPPGVLCSKGVCQCKEDYEMEDGKYCVKATEEDKECSSQGQGSSTIVTLGVCLLTIFSRIFLLES